MILLDTHATLWLVRDPHLLGERARVAIGTSDSVCYSAISFAEIVIKEMVGKIKVPAELEAMFVDAGLQPLSLTPAHAQAIRDFPELVGHDPFDRLLLAQALVERADFLTADRRLLALDRDWILDART